jgi:hypothetical protein
VSTRGDRPFSRESYFASPPTPEPKGSVSFTTPIGKLKIGVKVDGQAPYKPKEGTLSVSRTFGRQPIAHPRRPLPPPPGLNWGTRRQAQTLPPRFQPQPPLPVNPGRSLVPNAGLTIRSPQQAHRPLPRFVPPPAASMPVRRPVTMHDYARNLEVVLRAAAQQYARHMGINPNFRLGAPKGPPVHIIRR